MLNPPKLAICAIAKNEALYTEEWLAFHFLQGVSEILIFDNEITNQMRDILARVALHVPVSVVNWPGQDYYQLQMEAYREGAKRLIERADWSAFIDIDEFLFSSRNYPMPLELAEFGPEVGAIAVGHRIFGSSGQTAYEPELVTSRFVRCAKPEHPQSRWFKTLPDQLWLRQYRFCAQRVGFVWQRNESPACAGCAPIPSVAIRRVDRSGDFAIAQPMGERK
jgi:hypothetical protein